MLGEVVLRAKEANRDIHKCKGKRCDEQSRLNFLRCQQLWVLHVRTPSNAARQENNARASSLGAVNPHRTRSLVIQQTCLWYTGCPVFNNSAFDPSSGATPPRQGRTLTCNATLDTCTPHEEHQHVNSGSSRIGILPSQVNDESRRVHPANISWSCQNATRVPLQLFQVPPSMI